MPPKVPVPKPGPCKGSRRGKGARQKIRKAVGGGVQPRSGPGRRREGVRTSLMLAETVEQVNEVASGIARKLADRRIPFDLGGEDVDIAREHAEGILQGLERFPRATLRTVATFDSRDPSDRSVQGLGNAFAITRSGLSGSSIQFNRRYLDDPAEYRAVLARQVGHLAVPTPIGIGLHEFGHVVGADTLAATESKKIARNLAASQGSKPSVFLQNQLSAYSTEDRHELLAEAFADVMAHDTGASPVSSAIFTEVDRRYQSKQRSGGR